MDIEIKQIDPVGEDVEELFRLLDLHNLSHCPPEVCHLTQPQELLEIESALFGVYCDGSLCGMGGLKFYDSYAEVTRMFVKESFRGRGLATALLYELENYAIEMNKGELKLETSEKFESAMSLYLNCGFVKCAPFGEYINKPYNTYMEKALKNTNMKSE